MNAPSNAFNNPFIAGDKVILPAGLVAQMSAPDRGFTFIVPKETTVTVIDTTPARYSRYHNGKNSLFLPTILFRLNEKEYEAELTVDLMRVNNIDAGIMIFP